MKPLYTQEEFEITKPSDVLPCECYHCSKTFYKSKKEITSFFNGNQKHTIQFCSKSCARFFSSNKKLVNCSNCDLPFLKKPSEMDKSKSGNHFCSKSCSASYNNKNKSHGNKRSKLEIWIEENLTKLYPNLIIEFNQKSVIESELDIYIPSLNIAFELNGIFHYEPIYGINKLNQIQSNDVSKSKACFDNKIDLCVIDTSQQKYFKPSTSQKYLDIIINIINERLSNS
jgi:hypothetical protein